MEIKVTKLTDLMNEACSFTANKSVHIKSRLALFKAEHSVIRTVTYWVELIDIPTFVSTHLVRHHEGVTHFVSSHRPDRSLYTDPTEVNRLTPVNHSMFINAQALINMARKRLCGKASPETREVMQRIKEELHDIDPELYECLLPECLYKNGVCFELKSCGICPHWKQGDRRI